MTLASFSCSFIFSSTQKVEDQASKALEEFLVVKTVIVQQYVGFSFKKFQ